MSKLTLNEKGFSYLSNVTFFYTCIKDAVNKYQSSDKEWKVTVTLDKKTFKAYKKAFPKNISSDYEIDNAEFLKKYKVEEVPYPEQDEQYIVTLKQSATTKDGKVITDEDRARPKASEKTATGKVDITHSKLIGNGSKGAVAFTTWTDPEGNSYVYLRQLLVEDLVPYEGISDDAFGDLPTEGEEEPEDAFEDISDDSSDEDGDF